MIGISQNAVQQQKQTLSVRLQYAVRLLQMSSLDFAAMVQDQMGKNPFLEAEEGGDDNGGAAPRDATQAPTQAADDADGFADNDREIWSGDDRQGMRRADDDEIAAFSLTPQQVGLREHLRSQIQLQRLSERDRVLACVVAESLDADGYLRVALDELAAVCGLDGLLPAPEPQEMMIALRRVQALDPAGVGARDVAECLRLQLGAIACEQTRGLARRIVDGHLNLLAAGHVARLAQATKATVADVEVASAALRQLDPHPGWRFDPVQAACIVPNVIAFKSRGTWQAKLNAAVVPRVRMNQVYAELFNRHRQAEHRELDRHLADARWTVRNIQTRFSTILDVACAIVRRQRHFLEYGAMAMKPLALKEIADEVGVHESTVSRVTNNKYIATPAGIYELKYFFSRRMPAGNGGGCSGTAIRGLIKSMIEAERDSHPLSDAEIQRQLERQGLSVARRTVTKYRQMLKIAAGDRRRRNGMPAAAP